jgi:hypothetical protein
MVRCVRFMEVTSKRLVHLVHPDALDVILLFPDQISCLHWSLISPVWSLLQVSDGWILLEPLVRSGCGPYGIDPAVARDLSATISVGKLLDRLHPTFRPTDGEHCLRPPGGGFWSANTFPRFFHIHYHDCIKYISQF